MKSILRIISAMAVMASVLALCACESSSEVTWYCVRSETGSPLSSKENLLDIHSGKTSAMQGTCYLYEFDLWERHFAAWEKNFATVIIHDYSGTSGGTYTEKTITGTYEGKIAEGGTITLRFECNNDELSIAGTVSGKTVHFGEYAYSRN